MLEDNLPMKVHRVVRYRLHPGSAKKNQQLHGTAGACRFVWNHMVGKLRDEYEFGIKPDFHYYSMGKVFTVLRQHSYKWLQDYSAYVVKSSLQPIETSYKEFFKDVKAGGKLNRKPPQFHGKWTTTPSFSVDCYCAKVSGESLYVQKVGWMKLAGNNPYPDGEFKSGRIRYECGKWYAYLVYEVQAEASLPHTIKEVGIDRNVNADGWAVLSDGTKHPGPDLERKVARRRRYQRKMARQVKGSNRRKINKVKLQKAFRAERFARLNWAHHVSKSIASEYDVAYVEKLNIRGMTKSAKGTVEKPGTNVKAKSGLNRKIMSSAWGKLELCLNYKMEVRHAHPAYTSQTCHSCGHVDEKNRNGTDFKCTACGHADDADVNAALNILAFGNGATGRGDGGVARSVKRQEMVKVGEESSVNFHT